MTMDEREWELIRSVQEAQREYQRKIEPYIKELAGIRACRPPPPVVLPDGRVFQYTGPLPVWKSPVVP